MYLPLVDGECRGEYYGEVDERSHALAYGVLEGLDDLLVFVLHEVPLVHHHHERLVVALYELEYVHVLRLYAARGVEHEYAHVRVLYGAYGAHHRVELQVLRHLVLAAYAGRVNKVEVEAELVEARVYAVARGARYLRHDVAILAYECVDDAALAGVGSAHYGEAGDAFLYGLAALVLELREHEVEQVARAAARSCAYALRVAESEGVELRCVVNLVVVVGLVGHEYHWQLGAAQYLCHVLIPVGESRLRVYEEEHEVGLLRGHEHLAAYGILEYIIGVDHPSACVYYGEFASVPLALAVLAVACGACRVADYRAARLGEAIEEC